MCPIKTVFKINSKQFSNFPQDIKKTSARQACACTVLFASALLASSAACADSAAADRVRVRQGVVESVRTTHAAAAPAVAIQVAMHLVLDDRTDRVTVVQPLDHAGVLARGQSVRVVEQGGVARVERVR